MRISPEPRRKTRGSGMRSVTSRRYSVPPPARKPVWPLQALPGCISAGNVSRTLLGICPHDCVRPGSKSGSEGSRNRSGFCPEKEQIDDATKFEIGVVSPVRPKFPVASPANADGALTRVAAAMQAMTVIRDLVTDVLSLECWCTGVDRHRVHERVD